MTAKSTPVPARAVAPGRILRRELDARGWTQADLAGIIGRPTQAISELVQGKKQITPETALELAAAFGTSPDLWLNLESAYRLHLARRHHQAETIQRKSKLWELVPMRELLKRGWVAEDKDPQRLERAVLDFLGVASPDRIRVPDAVFHRTRTREPWPGALLAWERRVRALAAGQQVAPFDHTHLGQCVDDLLALTRSPSDAGQVPQVLATYGIGFVVVPHLERTYLDGAVLDADTAPIIALTLRYDRIDSFWFTLLHEVAHIVAGHTGSYLDDTENELDRSDPVERTADRLATEWLIPRAPLGRFIRENTPKFSYAKVDRFATEIGRHSGIIVGRLQHEGTLPPSHLRSRLEAVREYLVAEAA